MTTLSIQAIQIGDKIPSLETHIGRDTLVRYAGGSDDYAYQHWDHPRMTALGFPDVVVHGWLTFGHMCRAVTAWADPDLADIAAFAVRYRRPTYPGRVRCGGRVTDRRSEGAHTLIDLDLWAEGEDGQVTTTATMTLRLADATA